MTTKPLLSIVIVSYHAKHFLYLTLSSLYPLIEELGVEILVVDNSETNETLDFNKNSFPLVRCIKSSENLGFGKANNLGVAQSQSETILILNPDVIISKETIEQNIHLLNSDKSIGAIGVRMINGAGEYLPESKRGFPDMATSFYKLIGLNKLFKNSPKYNKYYHSEIDEQSIAAVDVLAGAAIFVQKSLYEAVGGFDPKFFMYGEDIDFSYQIHKLGYKIIYNGKTTIVHFKGESTQKNSWSYHDRFFGAMKIFWDKNFSSQASSFTKVSVTIAILGLKISSYLVHFIKSIALPLMDFSIIYIALSYFTSIWEVNIKGEANYYPDIFYIMILPFYALSWVFFLFISKLYQGEITIQKLFNGTLLGTLFILVVYFIVPENYRYSRAIVLFGALSALLIPMIIRIVGLLLFKIPFQIAHFNTLKATVFPSEAHTLHIENIFTKYSEYKIQITPLSNESSEIILDVESLSSKDIINYISLQKHSIWLYIHSTNSIIKSQWKHKTGLVLSEETNLSFFTLTNRFLKRGMDILLCFLMLCLFPFWLVFKTKNLKFFLNSIYLVLTGTKTWIMMSDSKLRTKYNLKKGIFEIKGSIEYLRNYSFSEDLYFFTTQLFKT